VCAPLKPADTWVLSAIHRNLARMNIDYANLPPELMQLAVAAVAIQLLIWGFYANTIRRTLLLIAPENRLMSPEQAWLLIIPLFNIYWNFSVASRLADSLTNEFYDRKIAEEENPGKSTGTWYAWLFLVTNMPLPSFLVLAAGLLALGYFVAYWVKVSNFRSLLIEHEKFRNKQENG